MYFRCKSLCAILNQYQKIVIYGAGDYAKKIYPKLVEWNLKEKIVCFMQTEEYGLSELEGVPVMPIRALDIDSAECVVLVAVSELYIEEIKEKLREYDYFNIVSLIDYRKTGAEFNNLNTFGEYCESIADWYVETHMNNLNKSVILQRLIKKGEGSEREKDSNLIVVISGSISARIVKITGALKRKQYSVVVLNCCQQKEPWSITELQSIHILLHSCSCIEEMLYNALQYCPLVYIFEPRWGDCSWVEIMLRNKQYFGKIVLALYDVLNDCYAKFAQDRLSTEKYALEHADGIIWRSFSKEYLSEKGFQYQGKSIQFLDYCPHMETDFYEMNSNSVNSDSSVVKLCSVNAQGDVYVEDKTYEVPYTDFARVGEILEQIGNRVDCCFHFYAGTLKKENIERCKWYEKKYKNFKFFLNIKHDELLRRLRDYDYGCYLYTSGEWPSDDVVMGMYSGSDCKNGVRNTFFDFLYAGLPIIATTPLKLVDYLKQYDVVIKMNLSDINIDYLRQNKLFYKEKVINAREELDIDNQVPRLIHFFEEI